MSGAKKLFSLGGIAQGIKLFSGGGGSSAPPPQLPPQLPTRFQTQTPGFDLRTVVRGGGTSTSLTPTGTTPGQIAFGERFPRILSDIDRLRGTVAPGFSDLRRSRLAAVGERRGEAIGNLRENLRRRRILGSSFGEDALIRAEREFAREASDVEAQSFLEELTANLQLIETENARVFEGLQFDLAQLGIAAGVGPQMAQLASSNARFAQELAAQEAAGKGKLFGSIAGALIGAGGTAAGAWLAGPPGAAAGGAAGSAVGSQLFAGGGGTFT